MIIYYTVFTHFIWDENVFLWNNLKSSYDVFFFLLYHNDNRIRVHIILHSYFLGSRNTLLCAHRIFRFFPISVHVRVLKSCVRNFWKLTPLEFKYRRKQTNITTLNSGLIKTNQSRIPTIIIFIFHIFRTVNRILLFFLTIHFVFVQHIDDIEKNIWNLIIAACLILYDFIIANMVLPF